MGEPETCINCKAPATVKRGVNPFCDNCNRAFEFGWKACEVQMLERLSRKLPRDEGELRQLIRTA